MDSKPKFAVFNSTGNLLRGEPKFNRSEYSEIAKKCDKAECSLFCRVDSTGTLILGRRLLVRAAGGREERVSVIAEFAGGDAAGVFETFYDGVQGAVENLEGMSYQVVGIWEEGDTLTHAALPAASTCFLDLTSQSSQVPPVRSPRESIPGVLTSLCAGKIIANEKITIPLATIKDGIALIRDVFLALRSKCRLKIPFSCALAKYHPETDLWVTPDDTGLQRGGRPDEGVHDREYFQALYCSLKDELSIGKTDREGLAREAKTKFFESAGVSNIIKLFPNRYDSLFRLYLHDRAALEKLFSSFHPNCPSLSDKTTLAVIEVLASGGRRNASGSDWLYPADPVSKYAPELIKSLDGDTKYQAWKILITKRYFIEQLVEELVSDALTCGNKKGIDLLSRMLLSNNGERDSFAVIIGKKTMGMGFDETVERMRAFLRWNGERSEAMKMMYGALRDQAERRGDLYRALTRVERAETLTWTGKEIRRKDSYLRRRRIRILLALIALFVVATILVFFVLPLVGVDLAGDILQVFSSTGDMESGVTGSEAHPVTLSQSASETGGE